MVPNNGNTNLKGHLQGLAVTMNGRGGTGPGTVQKLPLPVPLGPAGKAEKSYDGEMWVQGPHAGGPRHRGRGLNCRTLEEAPC